MFIALTGPRIAGALAGAALLCVAGSASWAAGGTGSATLTVLPDIQISQRPTQILSFGEFRNVSGNNCKPGTILLNAQTAKLVVTGTVSLTGGSPTFGDFAITGAPNSIYDVTLSPSAISSPDGFQVTLFSFYSVTAQSGSIARIGSNGTDSLQIGAVLSVPCQINTNNSNETVPSYMITVGYE